jgi:hypothetical protein
MSKNYKTIVKFYWKQQKATILPTVYQGVISMLYCYHLFSMNQVPGDCYLYTRIYLCTFIVQQMYGYGVSTIFQLYCGSQFYWRTKPVPEENHRPVASHWQTLSHNVVSSTPRLSGIRTHNFSGDRNWLHR